MQFTGIPNSHNLAENIPLSSTFSSLQLFNIPTVLRIIVQDEIRVMKLCICFFGHLITNGTGKHFVWGGQ